MRKKIFSIFSDILIAFAVILTVINSILIFNGNLKRSFIPNIFGYKFLIDVSNSMSPVVKAHDLLIIREKDNYDVKDIICYEDGNGILITHRIIDKQYKGGEELFQTKGDNNLTADTELVNIKDIEGSLVTTIGGVGGVILFLTTPVGIFTLVLIVVVLFLIDYLISKMKEDAN